MPPPAEGFAARFIAGPALRSQSDRRLVTLVREGYEAAFEEIVRRYGKPLRRYAAAIVGGHAEDVTQDAFSKALLALRRDRAEIELRPWLYRIVRNTALNDLRDRPPTPEAIAEAIVSGRDTAEEAEQRERLTELIQRLRELPQPQRAAIVMRELEGLSHEEIAVALGLSGGAARQAIYRARQALRDGLGMLFPLPLLKWLAAPGGPAAAEAAVGVGSTAGIGLTVKAAAATVLVAGAVGAGVAIENGPGTDAAATARAAQAESASPPTAPPTKEAGRADRSGDATWRTSRGDGGVGGDQSGSSRDREDGGPDSTDSGGDGEGHRSLPAHSDHSGHDGEEIDRGGETGDDHVSVEDHSGSGGELDSGSDGSNLGDSHSSAEGDSSSGSDSVGGSSGESAISESGSSEGGGQSTLDDPEPSSVEPSS